MSKGATGPRAGVLLSELVKDARELASGAERSAIRLASPDDWMSRANAESALALSRLASAAVHPESSDLAKTATRHSAKVGVSEIDDLRAPLLAALGAADVALATVNDLIVNLRVRAEETRTETYSRVEERRARLSKLQEDLPEQFIELRERFTSDELRKAAEGYLEAATSRYNELVERGEAALERLRRQLPFEDASSRSEGYVDQAVELTQEALGTVATQTRAVGERAAKLVGIELPMRAGSAKKAPAKKAPAKKAPAKKSAAKRATQK
jgi:heparin binding hemagglutinin HbhA